MKLILALLLAASSVAHADQKACDALPNFTAVIADDRDSGVARSVEHSSVDTLGRVSKAKPAAVEALHDVVDIVYDSPALSGERIGQDLRAACKATRPAL